MILKNQIKNAELANWAGSAKIAQKLFDQGESLTAINRYLTQKAGLNFEQSMLIIKHLNYEPDTPGNNDSSGGLSGHPQ